MKLASFAFVLPLMSCLTGCGDFATIDDPGFDKWCGSKLCEWDTDAGKIERVSTWNKNDYGVELVDTPTVLSQRIDVSLGECLRFKILADVEAEAQVSLDFDVFDDGVIDHDEAVPGVHWGKQELLVKFPETGLFDKVRLSLRKQGPGRAVFAELFAEHANGCEGEPFVVKPPAGSECTQDAECLGAVCVPDEGGRGICRGCKDDSMCPAGKLCGSAGETFIGIPVDVSRCIDPGSHVIGDQCRQQAECVADSICAVTLQGASSSVGGSTIPVSGLTSMNCSECSADADCGDGRVCGVADVSDAARRFRTCVVPESRSSGHACFLDAECENGRCCAGLFCAADDGFCPSDTSR